MGEKVAMPVKVGLAGVNLPASRSEIVLPRCRIRPADERDAEAMAHLKGAGELQTTDASGNTVSVSYGGDLVAEFDLPYAIRTADRHFFGAAKQDRILGQLTSTQPPTNAAPRSNRSTAYGRDSLWPAS